MRKMRKQSIQANNNKRSDTTDMKRTAVKFCQPLLAASFALSAVGAWAQDATIQPVPVTQNNNAPVLSFTIAPDSSLIDEDSPVLNIGRSVEAKDVEGTIVENALNFNLGVTLTPLDGLNFRADAWRQQIEDGPAVSNSNNTWQSQAPALYLDDSQINEFNIDNPLLGSQVESNGFDLGASYIWETNRHGQFTLSTKTTYVQNFENSGGLLELAKTDLGSIEDRVISPELQSSLMLTWQFGNHTASAITNYFDSFKDLSELDMEELNALVDNITTLDLQYGYSLGESDKSRAVISFGIRNIFNEKTAQILNSTTRILDQNGRVAYGSIKYQF